MDMFTYIAKPAGLENMVVRARLCVENLWVTDIFVKVMNDQSVTVKFFGLPHKIEFVGLFLSN